MVDIIQLPYKFAEFNKIMLYGYWFPCEETACKSFTFLVFLFSMDYASLCSTNWVREGPCWPLFTAMKHTKTFTKLIILFWKYMSNSKCNRFLWKLQKGTNYRDKWIACKKLMPFSNDYSRCIMRQGVVGESPSNFGKIRKNCHIWAKIALFSGNPSDFTSPTLSDATASKTVGKQKQCCSMCPQTFVRCLIEY